MGVENTVIGSYLGQLHYFYLVGIHLEILEFRVDCIVPLFVLYKGGPRAFHAIFGDAIEDAYFAIFGAQC